MNLEEATKKAMSTDYAVEAVGPAEINQADAGAFFLEGFLFAERQFLDMIDQSGLDMTRCYKCSRELLCFPEGIEILCKQCMEKDAQENVMTCSECNSTFDPSCEGVTTSDGKELCIVCQAELRDFYDVDWNRKNYT